MSIHTDGVTVSLSCDTLEVSRSGYYSWNNRPESKRNLENKRLKQRIQEIYEVSDRIYGSPRIAATLRAEGLQCSENRVARLMRESKIASEAVKRFKMVTTDSNHDLPIAERVFETENVEAVMAPNQVWAGDITYVC